MCFVHGQKLNDGKSTFSKNCMALSNFRFSPTRPPVHWSGIRTAFAHGPVCPQSLPPEAVEPEAAALKKV